MALIKIPQIKLPGIFPLRVVIARNPLIVVEEYKAKVNSFPKEVHPFNSKEGKRLEGILHNVFDLQEEQASNPEVYQAWNEVANDILIRLPNYVGNGKEYIKLKYLPQSGELKQ
jgi:hypothetical protein